MINIRINGQEYRVKEGISILDAAKANGIEIPTLCYHEKLTPYGGCGLCVVELKGQKKLPRACATEAKDGMEILTNTDRVHQTRKIALEFLLSDHRGDCRPPCVLACPAMTDCQGYVGLIANEMYKESGDLIAERLPLAASIGRVCPHPCEDACRRQHIDKPVAIAALKRFVGDINIEEERVDFKPLVGKDSGKRVAIVGGGPAGLSAAFYLRVNGHEATIYDSMPKLGGMLQYGIPEYRLPEKVIQKEIDLILEMGIKVKTNTRIGRDISIDKLRVEYDAVIIAIGAWVSSSMRLEGEDFGGVYGGIDFLRDSQKTNLGDTVAVVGGGNTAMDACRTAIRLGAKKVYTIYRRTREEMPAEDFEIEEAIEEGVEFKFLTNPVEIIGEGGKLKAIRAQKMELGEPDKSGRRSPIPIEGAYELIDLDSLILAIGQKVDLAGFENLETSRWGTIITDSLCQTNLDGVFACGDATDDGPGIAIEAIANAQKAAFAVNKYFGGELDHIYDNIREYDFYSKEDLSKEALQERFDYIKQEDRPKLDIWGPEKRKKSFEEYIPTYTKEEAVREAKRCLECGCDDYFECKLVEYANDYNLDNIRFDGFVHHRKDCDPHPHIVRDVDKCILCGLCVRLCEDVRGICAFGLVDRGFETVVRPEMLKNLEDTECDSCGLCVSACPVGALTETMSLVKNVPLKEKFTYSVCGLCNKVCDIKAASYGQAITRILPVSDLLCREGRFLYNKLILANRLKAFYINDKKVSHDLAIDKVIELIKASKNPLILLSASFTNEEAKLAKKFADKHGIKIYSNSFNQKSPNVIGLEELGIGPFKGDEDIDLLISFADDLDGIDLERIEKKVLMDLYAKEGMDVILPASPFFEVDGTYTSERGEKRVNRVIDPKSNYRNIDILEMLLKDRK